MSSHRVSRLGSRGRPRMRSPMMLRWISLVPPMIELARVDSRPRAQRPPSIAPASSAHEQRAGAEHVGRGLVEPLARAGPEQLHDARLRADLLAPLEPGERARVVQAEDLDVDPRLREPLAHARVGRAPARAHASASALDRGLEQHLLLPDERRAALVGERRVRDPPTLVLRTDEVLDRHLDVVEEHLVELVLAGHLAERAHVDALARPSGSRASRSPCARARPGRCARARCPCRRRSRTTTTPSARSRGTRRRSSARASRGSRGRCPRRAR